MRFALAGVAGIAMSMPVQGAALDKSFSPTAIDDGGVTVLTFVVANPAGAGALTDVGFADALPSGLRVAGAPNVGGTCANAAAATNASPGGSTITVANLQVPPGAASCTVTVDVTNAAGKLNPNCERRPDGFTNRRSNVTVANVVNDVSASCVTVGPVGPPVVNAPAPVPALHGFLLLLLGALLGAIGARARSRP